jgi:dienelactone hydrolase
LILTGTLCKPAGVGPRFPAVLYNHGGKEGDIGGAPEETCQALAEAGFVGFAPIRRTDLDFQGNLSDVEAGIEYLKALSYVDANHLGLIGFSRGGLLSLRAAMNRTDLAVVVVLAPAPPQGTIDENEIAAEISGPVLIQVAQNDLPSKLNGGENLLEQAQDYEGALRSAGKAVELQVLPPYQSSNDGHLVFFAIGEYWEGVVDFLRAELGD